MNYPASPSGSISKTGLDKEAVVAVADAEEQEDKQVSLLPAPTHQAMAKPLSGKDMPFTSQASGGGSQIWQGPPNSPSSAYVGLQYAPRQRSSIIMSRHSPSSFPSNAASKNQPRLQHQQQDSRTLAEETQSKSPSLLTATEHTTGPAPSPIVSTTPIAGTSNSHERIQQTLGNSLNYSTAAQTLGKQQMRADAETLGVRVGSVGWAILDRIQSASTQEWRELGKILERGEATLLLPTSPLKSRDVTLSHAYNHIVFATTLSPTPLLIAPPDKGENKDVSLVTFKGLRAGLVSDDDMLLEFRSFVARNDMSFVSDLRTSSRREDFYSTLAPLASSQSHFIRSPHFKVISHSASFLLPPSQPRNDSRTTRLRSTSSGSQHLPDQRQPNRVSDTFATLFGGRREKRISMMGTATDEGKEMKDITVLSSTNEGFAMEANHHDIDTSPPSRTISVAVIDSEIRRAQVLAGLAASMQERIRSEFSSSEGKALPNDIVEVICSFAAMFLPPSSSNISPSLTTDNVRSESTDTELSKSIGSAPLHAPFLLHPDQLADSFQDFFGSIKTQLEESKGQIFVEHELQRVENAVCREVYDRIFRPFASLDMFHDAALDARIRALSALGITLRHLGLHLPDDEAEERRQVHDGLDDIVQKCGARLKSLGDSNSSSPGEKLEILVSAHKIIVEGLSHMPKIELTDEMEADSADTKQEAADCVKTGSEAKGASSTSSADLILPILIFCVISAKPPMLASNLLFVQRFRAESLIYGEASYCLVNVQAAVAFLENVEPASLGLPGDIPSISTKDLEQQRQRRFDDVGSPTLESSNTISMPMRIRSRVAHDVGELAGMSNRAITGVLGSSLGAFGRMMGAGTTYAMGIDTPSTPLRGADEGQRRQKSVEDIRGVLMGSAAARLGSVLNKVVAIENEGKVSREAIEPLNLPRPSSRRLVSSRPATDYGETADDRGTLPPSRITNRLAALPQLSASNISISKMDSPAASNLALSLPNGTNPLEKHSNAEQPNQHSRISSTLQLHSGTSRGLCETKSAAHSLLSPVTPRSPTEQHLLLSPAYSTSPLEGPKYSLTRVPASLQSPYPPLHDSPTEERPLHIVLASTGSVASVKVPLIVRSLLGYENVHVHVISTKASSHFYDRVGLVAASKSSAQPEHNIDGTEGSSYTVSDLAASNRAASRGGVLEEGRKAAPRLQFWNDEDEWDQWHEVGDAILHIELRRWADIVLVAPCSANTLAKINAGTCDDLLTSFLRALSPSTPTFLFPAMNTLMYMHPLTARHIAFARDMLGYTIVGPIEKRLACGDLGQGAMQEWSDIVDLVVQRYSLVRTEKQLGSLQQDALLEL